MMFRKIRTFRRLEPNLRRMALEIVLLPLTVRAGFVLAGTVRTTRLLSAWSRRNNVNRVPDASAKLIADAVRLQRIVRGSLGIGGTCLVRSLVLQAVMRRRGLETALRIGVRKVGAVAEGHAWLEYQGTPVNETTGVTSTYVLFEGAAMLESWSFLP